MSRPPAPLIRSVRDALTDGDGRRARRHCFGIIRPRSAALIQTRSGLQESISAAKRAVIADEASLDRLLGEAVAALEANGCRVHLAADAREAQEVLARILDGPGLLVKSKSNDAKEVDISAGFSARGITVVETDLGDRICQLAGTPPGHTLAPAIQVPRSRVRELFSRQMGEALEDDPAQLVAVARRHLRQVFTEARYGLTGANAIAADTGAIVLVENEGNIRAATSMPEIHVVVTGITKLVPTLEDAFRVVEGASVFGAGQDIGTYVSVITGPAPPEGPGPREVHVVLVDNGRRRAVASGYGEAFACVNCGGCLNVCPVYAHIGDRYGGKLLGGVGVLKTAFTEGIEAARRHGLSLCLLCRRCVHNCPVGIDTPKMMARLRSESVERQPVSLRLLLSTLPLPERRAWAGSVLTCYQRSGVQKLVRTSGVLDRWAPGLACLEGMLPALPPGTDRRRWPDRLDPAGVPGEDTDGDSDRMREPGEVMFFTGCVHELLLPAVNRATVEVLRENGYRVYVPRGQVCCGALHDHAGQPERARALARKNIEVFESRPDLPVLLNAAGCGATLKEYGELLAGDPAFSRRARAFSERVFDVSEFLAARGLRRAPAGRVGRATYQDPCHLRWAQGIWEAPRRLLRSIPRLEFVEMDPGEACCGSAGTYFLHHPDLSSALLEEKLAVALATGADFIVTANPGCQLYLQSGLRRLKPARAVRVVHIMELLAAAYRGDGP